VLRHYDVDTSRSAMTGYSMGGYATYRLPTLYPDLFGKAYSIVGPPGAGIWEGTGGATISQQLAKVLYTGDGGWLTKLEQAGLAFKLEWGFDKAQILNMYLNSVYYGAGYYGVAAAAEGYFGVAAGELTWGQASLLAGLLQAPSAYDPTQHLDRARRRQRHVLDRLVATGVLTEAQADAVYAEPLSFLAPPAASATE